MKVLMLSKALVVGAYQRKLEELAALGIELTVAVPPAWRDERGVQKLERVFVRGYALVVSPVLFNGSFHFHFYPRLGALLERIRPDIFHIDEEPYNFATWHALRLAQKYRVKTLFFSWQNIQRQYPWPFSYFERYTLKHIDAAIVGNAESEKVWRAKGYAGPMSVIPQFGVDVELFGPHPPPPSPLPPLLSFAQERGLGGEAGETFTIGYAGRLVYEKGVDLLLKALAQLPPTTRLLIAGTGPERAGLEALAQRLGVSERVQFVSVGSTHMPEFYRQLDCFALPSRTRPNWKEQFGRVLVEAMACGVPVIGADSGEIPNVIGEAGLIFGEDDVPGLVACLRELLNDVGLRERLGQAGRARALEKFTQKRVAEETVRVYRGMLKITLPVLE